MSMLRKLARDWLDGLRAGIDVLLWGQAYPRTVDLRTLQRLRGGTMPALPALAPDEVLVTLPPGWNGPIVETSTNFTGRGRDVWLKPPTA